MNGDCDTTPSESKMAQSSTAISESSAEQTIVPPPVPPRPKTKSKSCGNSPKCSSREHSRPHSPANWKKPSKSGSPVAELEREGGEEAPFGRDSEAGSAYSSPYSERATPPYLRWAKSLDDVLDDYEGMELFKQYLAGPELNESHYLDFWYACKGLRQLGGNESEKVRKVAERLYADYVATRGVHFLPCLSRDVRTSIHERLISSNPIDQSMYDEAHKEVQVFLRDRHAMFVTSDVYIQYLQDIQAGGGESPKCFSHEVHSNNSSSSGEARRPSSTLLPTVHEDTEFESESERLAAAAAASSSSVASAAPVSSTAPKIFTTSEVESSGNVLWSNQNATGDAKSFGQQEDILSQAISATSSGLSNIDGATSLNTAAKRRAASVFSSASQHSRSTGSTLTRDSLNATFGQRLLGTKPISRGGVPINPYHAPYVPYLPTSAQDSELQSMSSDATTESGFSGANYQRKEHRIMQQHVEHNRDFFSNQNVIPRTERSRQVPPPQDMTNEGFRHQVREKLEKIRRKQEEEEKLEESLKRLSEPENGHNEHRVVVNKFYEEKSRRCQNDEADSILDDHCSRVPYFKDSPKQSPLRSPGFTSVGRRRSPIAKSPIRAMTTSYPSAVQPQLASFSNPNARMVVDPTAAAAALMSQSVIQTNRSKSGHHSAGNTIHRAPKHEQFVPVPPAGPTAPIDKRITGAVAKRPAVRYPPAASDTSGIYSGTSTEPSLVSARFTPNLVQRSNEQHWMSDNDALRHRMRGASTNNAAPPMSNAASESKSHRSGYHRNTEKSSNVEKSRNQKPTSDGSTGTGQIHKNLPTYPRRSDQSNVPPPFLPSGGAGGGEITVGVYYPNDTPFLVRYPGRQLTLKQFKQLIPKKGNYRYFFQCVSDELGTGTTVQREVMEDHEVLPFSDYNKIVAKVINNE